MTDSTPQQPDDAPQLDDEVIELAGRLFDAARTGDSSLLARYLDAGAPAELANERGDSLVMLAAYHGHAETVRVLLDHGADADRLNDRGQTPLAGAVFKGAGAVIDVLLAAGANPAAGTPSALDTARMFGKEDLVSRFETR